MTRPALAVTQQTEPPPFWPPRSRSHTHTHVAFSPEMAEVEKLKQQRREQNAAKRAAGETVSTDASADDTAPTPVLTPTTPAGPVEQIAAAEAKMKDLMTEIGEVKGLVVGAKNGESLDAAAKRQAAVAAGVGKLTAMMDEIDIGEIEDDEAKMAARVRRKAINKNCALASSGDVEVDGELAAAAADLKKAVVDKRKELA